ncbi:MAG: ankyrin repeat domain-containing protein [Treponema sp.]|nr:ankyrin repeat domain-containing protein [Treponema sp.]
MSAVCCVCLITALCAEESGDTRAGGLTSGLDNAGTGMALFKACMKEDVNEVRALLQAGADVNTVNNGISLLMFAVNTGQVEIVKLLVSAGADVHYKNEAGISALFFAAYAGNKDMVNALLLNDIGSDDTSIAVHIALLQENTDVAARLQEAAEYGKLDYRKLRRDEYKTGAHFKVYCTVSRIFVDEGAIYRAACYLMETRKSAPNVNYEFFIESKERFPFIEGDSIEAMVSYRTLEHVEVSAVPYRAVEQAIFHIDSIIEIW